MPCRPRRAAYTLVELLVVIAILGVLLGLVLPTVQKGRLAAARMESKNNLRQIALAVGGHQITQGSLPDNKTLLDSTNPGSRSFSSVLVKLLPYIDQDNLYQAALQQGMGALEVTVRTYTSPADGSSAVGTAAFSSYVANDYLFGIKDGASLTTSVPDGLSCTILFTEHYMAVGSPPTYNSWVTAVDGISINKQHGTRAARLASADPPQFGPPQTCSPDLASTQSCTGILTAMADGSVCDVSPAAATTSPSPESGMSSWQAALTPSGNEASSPGW